MLNDVVRVCFYQMGVEMILYWISDINKTEAEVKGKVQISERKYKEMHRWFDFVPYYHICRSMKKMVIESGNDFLIYSKEIKNIKRVYNDNDLDRFLITANKLLISYLSFISVFIDTISCAISQKSEKQKQEFQEFDRLMYDKYFSYRFLKRMRNYVTHNCLPILRVSLSTASGIKLALDKDELLKFKKWSTVKNEIDKLPKYFEIDIYIYIEECQKIIEVLYLKSLEFAVDDVVSANKNISNICKLHDISFPVVIVYDLESNQVHMEQFPIYLINDYINDLKRHPSYNIELD